MLILSRKPNESLVILDEDGKTALVTLTVLAVEGDKVKIGITAPREVGILRHELWQSIQEQNRVAEQLAAGEPELSGFDELRKVQSEETDIEEHPDPQQGKAGDQPDDKKTGT